MDLRNNASFSSYAYSFLLTITAFSEECVAKLVHGVLLLYLVLIVVSSALERLLLVAARVRRSTKSKINGIKSVHLCIG